MSNIEWGPEIKVNGERPAWLGDGDKFNWCGCAYVGTGHHWEGVSSIRLPADHWANAAINAGFEPWGGGDSAPEDWDGGEVLWKTGKVDGAGQWQHKPEWLEFGYVIIGYRKRTEPQAGDTVTIQRMSQEEWAELVRSQPDGGAFSAVKALGIIKPEPTKAERIAADTGIDLATVERVLAAAS